MKLIASVNPEYVPMGYTSDDGTEKLRENVNLQVELGQGSFGMVSKGQSRTELGNFD